MPGFSDVEFLAIIRDANPNAEAAFQSIKDVIRKQKKVGLNFEPPSNINEFAGVKPKLGIFIMPGNSDKGMLEDLCLKTVENHPAMKCVKSFIDCVINLKKTPKNIAKAKAQAFLAAMPEVANRVAIGAQKGYWNFDSDELTELKLFLENLR